VKSLTFCLKRIQ